MGLITSIMKKYEEEGKARIAEARKTKAVAFSNYSGSVRSAPSLEETVLEQKNNSSKSFELENKLIDIHRLIRDVNLALNEIQSNSAILEEFERFRTENIKLKEKLRKYEPEF